MHNQLSRSCALFLTTLMLLSTFLISNPQISLAAGTEPAIKISSCQIAPGETEVVAITAQNIPSPGLAGYEIGILYDPLKLEVVGLEKSSTDSFTMQIPNLNNSGIAKLSAIQAAGVEGDITLARLKIKANQSAEGDTQLKLTIYDLVLEDLKSIQAQATNGQVKITASSGQTPEKNNPLSLNIVSLPDAEVNQPYSVTLTANNGTPPYSWSASGLPEGLTMNSKTGEISGKPTSKADSSFVQVSLTDSQSPAQTVSAQFPLEVIEEKTSGSSNSTEDPIPTKPTTPTTTPTSPTLPQIPSPANSHATTRIFGNTATQTAAKIAEQTGWTGTAILASSTSYGMVDALTAGPLASYLKAPILLTEAGNSLNADTKAALTKLKVKTIYVTSGTGVISQAILDELKEMGIKVESLGGTDRFATSANIAQKMVELGAPVTKAAVAYGWTPQDALSIASIASAQTQPILLTEKDKIPASVQTFLAAHRNISHTDVIGGTGVISEEVKALLPGATRHFGLTAYDTNAQVIRNFDSLIKYDRVYLANGETAIDALAGAPLAAQSQAAIVLTNQVIPEAAVYVKGKISENSVITALGGAAVVPANVIDSIAAN